MNFVILGCGRVGSRLAQELVSKGHQVAVIDQSKEALEKRLPADFPGKIVLGIGFDEDVLREAGIEKADVFAAVTNGDNTNIMASQVAKEIFGVPRVLARIYDPVREDTYHTLGLDTICPTTLITNQIIDAVVPGAHMRDSGVHIGGAPTNSRPPIGAIVSEAASPAFDPDLLGHGDGSPDHSHADAPAGKGRFGWLRGGGRQDRTEER